MYTKEDSHFKIKEILESVFEKIIFNMNILASS